MVWGKVKYFKINGISEVGVTRTSTANFKSSIKQRDGNRIKQNFPSMILSLGNLDWEPEVFLGSKGGVRIKPLIAESKQNSRL